MIISQTFTETAPEQVPRSKVKRQGHSGVFVLQNVFQALTLIDVRLFFINLYKPNSLTCGLRGCYINPLRDYQ